jgi:hypothetical protein
VLGSLMMFLMGLQKRKVTWFQGTDVGGAVGKDMLLQLVALRFIVLFVIVTIM